ncbi:MAG: hypothetical protein NTZ02_04285 [Candidatus Woesearchaeota archaeon]|nr:hypothetical protein [Candidatus Woesearchaeota archaeon]
MKAMAKKKVNSKKGSARSTRAKPKDLLEKQPSEDYFVSLVDPLETRRKILETSKQAVKLLQMSNNLAKLRRQREETITELSKKMNELSKLISMVRRIVPEMQAGNRPTNAKELISRIAKPVTVTAEKQEKQEEAKLPEKSSPELEALEKELSEIEKKLGKL